MPDQLDNIVQLIKQGAFQEAADALETMDGREAQFYRGVCAAKLKQHGRAESFFQSVLAGEIEDLWAFKANVNLASIYKRKPDATDQLTGYRFLEAALLLAGKLMLDSEKDAACEKLARYVVDLDLFDRLSNNRLGLDWSAFRHRLPIVTLPADTKARQGIVELIMAFIRDHHDRDFNTVRIYLKKALHSFRQHPNLFAFVADYQNEVLDRASSFYDKALLLDKVQQDQADLGRLFEVGRAISSVLDVDELLTLILDQVIDIVHAERGLFILKDNDGQLKFHIARNDHKDTLDQAEFAISQSIVDQAVESRKPLLLSDVGNDDNLSLAQSVVDLQLKSVLCVPLVSKDNILGVIYVDNSLSRSTFGQRQLNLLITLASQAKIAIENASLYQNLEQKVEERTRELRAAIAELTALNNEKTEIMGIVSHDLKNPLTSILGLSHIIMEMGANDVAHIRKFATDIHSVGQRMLKMVHQLLELNKIEEDQLTLSTVSFDLAVPLTFSIQSHLADARKKRITIAFDPPEKPMLVYADDQATNQVFNNLLSNAIKFSPPETCIFIRISENHDSVRCEIQDEGQGLTAADMPKLFGKFTRLSAKPTGDENSTGLGLSIVKKLVEAMLGRVWAESDGKGCGATFIVELPKPTSDDPSFT